jgi:hypothetical protein
MPASGGRVLLQDPVPMPLGLLVEDRRRKSDFSPDGTASILARVPRSRPNAMKPRIDVAWAHGKSHFMSSSAGLPLKITLG